MSHLITKLCPRPPWQQQKPRHILPLFRIDQSTTPAEMPITTAELTPNKPGKAQTISVSINRANAADRKLASLVLRAKRSGKLSSAGTAAADAFLVLFHRRGKQAS